MTQSLLYKGVRRLKPRYNRARTHRNIDLAQHAIEEINGDKPLPSNLWMSVMNKDVFTRRFSSYLWKTIHEGHKMGRYFEHIPNSEEMMSCSLCDTEVESMHHVLFECRGTGQEFVWKLFNETWDRTGIESPFISIGLVMGLGLVNILNAEGATIKGLTRLFRILVSEATHLIWQMRCEWRIEFEGEAAKIHAEAHVRNKWLMAINRRLRYDRILTDVRSYGRKAIKPQTVEETWTTILDETLTKTLPPDWVINLGVLVGIGKAKRPPGRNR
ncbi:hypothetical protein BKA70DRAFT_1373392 [Coprinopsis sp. MPI-PUGE-AT-0042]|nr:hypothetical protein BKA70DRAFT_1373392 [Coprinopsis sp. MPI-PUGE-AT-0042]